MQPSVATTTTVKGRHPRLSAGGGLDHLAVSMDNTHVPHVLRKLRREAAPDSAQVASVIGRADSGLAVEPQRCAGIQEPVLDTQPQTRSATLRPYRELKAARYECDDGFREDRSLKGIDVPRYVVAVLADAPMWAADPPVAIHVRECPFPDMQPFAAPRRVSGAGGLAGA
jgi:hypothetical protein